MAKEEIEHEDELDPDEDMRMDNKIKRLELELKGAKFIEHNPMGIELPPEIEGQMLDQIMQFEKMKFEAKEVSIYDFIGKPRIKKIEKLSSEEIILEKDRLMRLMEKKGIILSSMAEVDDLVMYKFITEEFFQKKMLDMNIDGFIRHYIYEEFHPNEGLNIERTIEIFFNAYMSDEEEFAIKILCRKELREYLINFKDMYARLELESMEIDQIFFKKTKGEAIISICFEAYLENSLKSHRYQGDIKVELKKSKKMWQISHFQFPKLNT